MNLRLAVTSAVIIIRAVGASLVAGAAVAGGGAATVG